MEALRLKREMIVVLGREYGRDDGWRDDAEIAIYWFAVHYHSGQWSALYEIQCNSYFRPGPFSTLDSEDGSQVIDYYDLLETQFGEKV